MPKVWLPKVPFVVAARIWTAPGWLPNASEPRPQPAVPYCRCPSAPGGERVEARQHGESDGEAHAILLVFTGESPRRAVDA